MIVFLFLFLLMPIHSTIVIRPIFTETAYQNNGWYETNSTSVKLNEIPSLRSFYSGSYYTWFILRLFYDTITDEQLNNNPDILKKYDRVILLHNEYVTHNEYNAIMNHTNVFYAYPNSLYKYVELNKDTITLGNMTNNPYSLSKTQYTNEYENCGLDNIKIVEYPNGKGLNCFSGIEVLFNPLIIWNIISQ